MSNIIEIHNLSKKYKGSFTALDTINLNIQKGEIFALLGPNGAGKTTLINLICGINQLETGQIYVDGQDIIKEYRHTRSLIGLVPQELTVDAFEKVQKNVAHSRSLFGLPADPVFIEKLLKDFSLWDKRNNQLRELSGGMKRRLMIAKALSHEPKILFLDEPSAGVDVALRKTMWEQILALKNTGVTIILTTHYIEEAEALADRVAVINKGKILTVENKHTLMANLGKKQLRFHLSKPLNVIPSELAKYPLTLTDNILSFSFKPNAEQALMDALMADLHTLGILFKDIDTQETSLEDIFVEMVANT